MTRTQTRVLKWGSALLALGVLAVIMVMRPRSDDLPPAGPIALIHATVIDVVTGAHRPAQTILVNDGRITQIASDDSAVIPANARVIDVARRYVVPGFWDMHVHGPLGRETAEYRRLFVANGVTGVRSMETELAPAEINRKPEPAADLSKIGPRVVRAGRNVNGPGGLAQTAFVVRDETEASAAVDSLHKQGLDLVKVYNLLPRAAYFAILRRAADLKIPVAGHVPFAVGATEASDSGQLTIEHLHGISMQCSAQETQLRSELLAEFQRSRAERKPNIELTIQGQAEATLDSARCDTVYRRLGRNRTWQTPTLVLYEARAAHSPNAQNSLRTARRHVRGLHAAGARFLVGSDLPALGLRPGVTVHDEMRALVRSGLTPLEALQAGTLNPAIALGATDSLGTVETGKLADLVVLAADPTAAIDNTRRIEGVVLRGRYISQKQLRSLLKDAKRERIWQSIRQKTAR